MGKIFGEIIDKKSQKPLAGLQIQLWDIDRRLDKPLAAFKTDQQGKFISNISSDYLLTRFGRPPHPKLYLNILKDDQLLHSTKDTLQWDPTQDLADVRIEVNMSASEEKLFTVSGNVRLADGTPFADAVVVTFDKDIRRESEKEEQELGRAVTDKDGRYTIEYSKDKFQLTPAPNRLAKDEPDLIIKVYKDDSKTPLVASDLKLSAGRSETIHLTIPQKVYRGKSEYDRLITRVETFLGGKPVTDLKEDDKRQDITFVARKTNTDPQRLRSLINAKTLAKDTAIAPEFFFALARHGLAIDSLQTIIVQRLPAVRRAIDAAIEANTLPESFTAEKDAVVEQLRKLAVEQVLGMETAPERVSIGALLATSSLDRRAQECLVSTALEHEVGVEDFWSQLAKTPAFGDGNAHPLKEARSTLQLGALTGYHLPLVQALQAELHDQGQLRDLAHLARLPDERWEALVRQHGVPEEITGEDEEARIKTYTRALQRQVESAYPTAAIAARIGAGGWPHADALKAFFDANPDFDLLTDSVERTENINLTEPAKAELKRVQRLARVTPHFKEIKALMEAGISSAQQIGAMSQGAFTVRYGYAFDNDSSACQAYQKASQRYDLTTHLSMRYNNAQDHGRYRDIPPSLDNPSAPADIKLNLETLFGSQDMCQCDHCQSMRGPAAYLVDLLQFLNRETLTGLTVLFAPDRRPDIEKIMLNCHNTDTPMPYIDLVNEIFEQAVIQPRKLEAHQTTWTGDELAANPEHVISDAYVRLKERQYPWRLPFDLAAEEARIYLEHLGTRRYELMELFHTGDPLADTHVAAVYLGLNNGERLLLDGSGEFEDRDLWGLKQPDWLEVLTDPDEVLHRSGLTLEELTKVLSLGFVNGWTRQPYLKISYGSKCALDEAHVNLDEDRDAPARLCRFVRLWRKLGWTMAELNAALMTLRPEGTVGYIPLLAVSHLLRLRERLKMTPMEILSFYGDLNNLPAPDGDDEEATFFKAVFFNRRVCHPEENEDFINKLNSGGQSLITQYLPQVTSALGVGTDDVQLLLDWLPPQINAEDMNKLTHANLSHLYRVTRLCRATRLKVGEFIALADLAGIYPLIMASETPGQALRRTLDFMDALAHVKASVFSIRELDELLRHQVTPESVATTIRDNAIVLQQIRSGLKNIAKELPLPKEADLIVLEDLLRQKLARILPPEAVDLVFAWLQSDPAQLPANTQPNRIWTAKVKQLTDLAKAHPELSFLKQGQPLEALPKDEKKRTEILEKRYRKILAELLPYLEDLLSRSLIKQQLAEALALEPALAEQLLENWVGTAGAQRSAHAIQDFQDLADDKPLLELTLPTQDSLIQEAFPDQQQVAEAYPAAFENLTRLRKIALVLSRLEITYAEARYLFSKKEKCWLDLAGLPVKPIDSPVLYKGWKRLVDVCQLRDRLGGAEPSLFDLFELAEKHRNPPLDSSIPTRQGNPFLEALLTRTDWDAEDFKLLCTRFRYDMADFTEELALVRLECCFRKARALGVTIAEPWHLIRWVQPVLESNAAASMKRAAKAKYSDSDQWLTVARPLQDAVRESKRTALVDYLTFGENETADDLYSSYLIDPEMSGCMLTSRIKQAISSVQLFIQRIFLKLENVRFADRESASIQWDWMKNYRVWEANRRIFLYPENWIEPELRDDKSPFFIELENELRQNEITSAYVEKVYLNYLKKLDSVSNLDIVAHCYGRQGDGIMHVFGRTRSAPHVYYYRFLDKHSIWSPWEAVELDIEGDHLLPAVWNDRLFLFWPIFIETPEKPIKQHIGKVNLKGEIEAEVIDEDNSVIIKKVIVSSTVKTKQYWTIQLGWSEYYQGKWTAIQISKEKLLPMASIYNDNKNILSWDFITRQAFAFLGLDDENNLKMPQIPSEIQEWINRLINLEMSKEPVYLSDEAEMLTLIAPPNANTNTLFEFKINSNQDRIDINVSFPALIDSIRIKELSSNQDEAPEISIWVERTINKDNARVFPCGKFIVMPKQISIKEATKEPVIITGREWKTVEYPMQAMSLIGFGDPMYYGQQNDNIYLPNIFKQMPLWQGNEPQRYKITFPCQKYSELSIKNATLFFISDSSRNLYLSMKGIFSSVPKVHYHPFISTFIEALSINGLDGLLRPKPTNSTPSELYRQRMVFPIFGENAPLEANPLLDVGQLISYPGPYPEIKKPREDITFEDREGYSLYNWELFFHIPLLIADRLSKNQRFEEAMQWFHYIFDPLTPDEKDPYDWQRPWKFGRFFDNGDATRRIEELMMLLSKKSVSNTSSNLWSILHNFLNKRTPEAQIKDSMTQQLDRWRDDPFKPHLLARLRITPYMKTVVMKYLDNLVAWADQLFRRDSIESVNEATQLYILATQLLGPRPRELPERVHKEHTYAELKDYLDKEGPSNVLEDEIPDRSSVSILEYAENFASSTLLVPNMSKTAATQWLSSNDDSPYTFVSLMLSNSIFPGSNYSDVSIENPQMPELNTGSQIEIPSFWGHMETPTTTPALPPPGLYFCIPPNEQLLSYWDKVADRLFKIRHCMNIEGQVRQLPLFEPVIDPALLVRVAAAGVDYSSVLNDLSTPAPHYRFSALAQKASELCQEVKSLGAGLLSALEKRDAEKLALMRSNHEIQLLKMVRDVRKHQLEEAKSIHEGLLESKTIIELRTEHFNSLINNGLIEEEKVQLDKVEGVIGKESEARDADRSASFWSYVPDIINNSGFYPGTAPGGLGGTPRPVFVWHIGASITGSFGGSTFVRDYQSQASARRSEASSIYKQAELAGTKSGHIRRAEEWRYQLNMALAEAEQTEKQIKAAEFRKLIADQELSNHEQQMQNAKAIDEHFRLKFTNEDLYDWMAGQISTVYFQSYQLAYDTTKQAERAYRFELGLTDSNFIQFGYWDNLKKGLLAGERLALDLKRLEASYLEKNKRDYEITKHLSLLMLDPQKLLNLRETGTCEFDISELAFDLDHPGQYMRRIKSVGLTIPCITGPYTGVSAKLTLLKNRIRRKTDTKPQYAFDVNDFNRDRFIHNLTGISSIATSSAQNDHGLFELNFQDERYLPFEGAGVISTWRLELPSEFRQFDYDTISDVILHISYTAREGGDAFKGTVNDEIKETINYWLDEVEKSKVGLPRLFSLRHEFPNAFHKLLNPAAGAGQRAEFELGPQHFPHFVSDRALALAEGENVTIYLKPKDKKEIQLTDIMKINATEIAQSLFKTSIPDSDILTTNASLPDGSSPLGTWTLDAGEDQLKKEDLDDIFILIKYSIGDHQR